MEHVSSQLASQRTNELGQAPGGEHQVGQELSVEEPQGLQLAVCLPGLQQEGRGGAVWP